MQVSVETTKGLERKLTISVPGDKIESEIQKRLQSLSKKAKIQGFRPGKVPLSVVKRNYGEQVQQEVVGEILQSSFVEAVTQEKLNPANPPQIDPKMWKNGEPFEYSATFEIYPEITLAFMEGVEIEKPAVEIETKDIDNVIERLREQKKDWAPVERASQKSDKITLDFKGFIGDEAFEGGEAKAVPLELGSGRMIPGFEDQLIGAKAGDEPTLEVTFPEDYQSKDLAGKTARFETKVITVEEPKLAEINEDFIKSLGIEAGTTEALNEDIKKSMQRELDEKIKSVLKQNVMDKLLEINTLDVPNSLIDKEIEALKSRSGLTSEQLATEGVGEAMGKGFEDEARKRVVLGLLLSETVKQNNIKTEPKKVRELVENLAASYEKPQEVLQYYYSDNKRLAEIESVALENETVELLVSQAKINESKTTFDELMKPSQTVS